MGLTTPYILYHKHIMKKHIKISFKNFWYGFTYKDCPFYYMLLNHYDVEVVDIISSDIDLLFISVFNGEDNISDYYGTIKTVFVSYENIYPNFNKYDYSIGYYNLLSERSFRYPLYAYYDYVQRYDLLNENRPPFINEPHFESNVFNEKTDDIAVIISNNYRDGKEYLQTLADNFVLKSGGKFHNNTNVGPLYNDKITFYNTSKFGIAFENADDNDYVTEKIYDCYVANTIPIYFGADNIDKDFNPKSFIDVKKYKSPEDLINHIQYLMHNKEAYMDMLNQKRIINYINYDSRCEEFLINIVENGKIYNHIYGGIGWFNYGKQYRIENNLPFF